MAAYVPIPYPTVLYSATGVPQPAATAAIAATLPAEYAVVPVVAPPTPPVTLDPALNFTPTVTELVLAAQLVPILQPAGSVPLVLGASVVAVLLL